MEKDADPLLSIITVNYNGKDFLPGLFQSLAHLDYPQSKLQIIMVDNASTDGSVDFVQQDYPWVQIVALDKNTASGPIMKFQASRFIILHS